MATTPNEKLPSPTTPMMLVAQALNSGASMETLERMIALQERWEANEARKAFETAMAEAAKQMPIINKTSQVMFDSRSGGRTNYRHADLAEIVQAVAPVLGAHGLSHRFITDAEPGKPVKVTCVISHKQGHSISNALSGPHDTSGSKNAIQAMGSTITYLSRYTLMAVLGLAATKDDDGAGGAAIQATEGKPRPTSAPAAADPSTAREPAHSAPSASSASTSHAEGMTMHMTISEIKQLEDAARAAADKGSPEFGVFWRNHNSEQERHILTGLGTDLRERLSAADNKMAEDMIHDQETGEILDGQET